MPQFKMISPPEAGQREERHSSGLPTAATILLADPDPVLRQSMADVLARTGYPLLAAVESLEEATRLVRKLRPSLLILGCTEASPLALETVRAIHSAVQPAIVLLAPVPNLEWVRQVRSAGADALLARPPREADLAAAVELSLGSREQEGRLREELSLLRERLEANSLLQRAKEVLMRRDGLSELEAYQKLRGQAERTGRPVNQIAEAVVLAAAITA